MSAGTDHVEEYRGRPIFWGTTDEVKAWVFGYCYHGGSARLVSTTPTVYRLGYVPDHTPGSM